MDAERRQDGGTGWDSDSRDGGKAVNRELLRRRNDEQRPGDSR